MATLTPEDYRQYEPPTSAHNRAVARTCGWTFDEAYNAYRDAQNFVMLNGAPPQPNATDCWK